jgi:hypothetical protein
MVARRAYAAPVIWAALVAHAQGLGYRRIAIANDLPQTTVRDWLRAMRRNHPGMPGPGHAARGAVLAIQRCAGILPAWRMASRVTDGRLLLNTSPPHAKGSFAAHRLRRCRYQRRGPSWAVSAPE